MPKADATGLAPEKSAEQNPPALSSAPEGSLLCPSASSHFYGGVSERRPWVFKREDRPKGAPNSSAPWLARDTTKAPSQTAKLAGEQSENLGGKDRDPLHLRTCGRTATSYRFQRCPFRSDI